MSNYNPLVLGSPLDTSATTGVEGNNSQETRNENENENGVEHGIASEQDSSITGNTGGEASSPDLHRIRTAPTTVPAAPQVAGLSNDKDITSHEDSDHESSTATLAGSQHGQIPLVIGGPLPGSKVGLTEKDIQASGVGGKTGPEIADLAAAELGLKENEKPEHGHEHGHGHHHYQSHHHISDARVERTLSGTQVTRQGYTGTGDNTMEDIGMTPVHLTRQLSQPPAVSPWGGVAPSGEDQEEGLRAVRSRESEDERDAEREKKGPDPWAVKFEPGEKINPKNWSEGFRWYLTGLAGFLVLNSTFASSAPSGIVTDMQIYFGFSQEIAVLTISLFVAGYCLGPLLWGPLSESYGRKWIFIIAFIPYIGFQVGCALSKNTASILLFRFLGGIFASSPLTNSGALLADIWDGDHRGQAMSLFALAPFAGPSIGPIVAGFISVAGVDWRWVYWILAIFSAVCLGLIVFTLPETYAPTILVKKAKKLRKETGQTEWYAPLERTDHSFNARLYDILAKPFIILALEPMLIAVTVYMSFIYGVVYLLFEAYPFVFIENHGFNTGEEGLAFLGFFGGGFLSVIIFLTVVEPRYQRYLKSVAPAMPRPEKRLELCIFAGWALAIAMFWFGWTSYSSIHWISPVLAGGLIGVGVLGMFVSLFNYIIDVYLWSAASALAATTVSRSIFGAVFPLFAVQMYQKLGTQWASSLLGFIALALAPIPLVLYKYGPWLRSRSRFVANKS